MLSNGHNSFATCTNGITGKRGSLRGPYDGEATREQLVEVFSVRSVQMCYKQDKSRLSPDIKDVNTEGEVATALEATIRRQPVKTQQSDKN
jgi:hypothetical protein